VCFEVDGVECPREVSKEGGWQQSGAGELRTKESRLATRRSQEKTYNTWTLQQDDMTVCIIACDLVSYGHVISFGIIYIMLRKKQDDGWIRPGWGDLKLMESTKVMLRLQLMFYSTIGDIVLITEVK
jgi:hypothetical protein